MSSRAPQWSGTEPFESRLIKQMCDMLQIAKTRTTPYRPSANGQVERMNRTICRYYYIFFQDQQTDWYLHLGTVGMAIRSTVNRQTGFTPDFLMLGREVLQPIDSLIQPDAAEHNRGTPGTYAARHREQNCSSYCSAESTEITATEKEGLRSASGRGEKYSVCDAVYRFNKSIVLGQCKKLLPIWSGPWIMIEVISSVLYRISNRKRSLVTHHD